MSTIAIRRSYSNAIFPNVTQARSRIKLMFCASSMEGGGSERQLLYLLERLDRARFDLRLYLVYRKGSLLERVPADVPIDSFWDQNRQRLWSWRLWNWPGRIHRMQVKHLAKTIEEHNIQVVYDRLFHAAMITGPAVAKCVKAQCAKESVTPQPCVRRVSTIVSPPSRDVVRSEKRWLYFKKRLLSASYRSATRLLAVSHVTAVDAKTFYDLGNKQIEVVPSPVDWEQIDKQADAPIADSDSLKLWQHNGGPRVVSVGRLSSEKGHRYLIDALGIYMRNRQPDTPALKLHLLGDGPCRSDLERQVRDLGLVQQVHFHGHVANPYPYMKQCDLFVLPSLYEGLPNALLEAMACRATVLATNTDAGAGELLREHPLGSLAEPGNALSLAEQMQNRFQNADNWDTRREPAREFVLLRHDFSQWIDRMSSIFEESGALKGG
ncbi:glycosyltransferase [Pirellulaceae bacterium SH449]